MDEKLQTFLCVVGGGGFFAVLGGVFGAISGSVYWQSGRASGTAFGLGVARAFDRVSETGLSRGARGAITGAADGVLFLGTLGLLAGGIVAYNGWFDAQWLMLFIWLVLFLMAAAVAFGLLAYAIIRSGIWGLAPAVCCGLVGAVAGARIAFGPGLYCGLIAGMILGTAMHLFYRAARKRSHWSDDV